MSDYHPKPLHPVVQELRRREQGRLTPSEQLDRSFDFGKAWTDARAAVDAWAAAGYPDP